MQFVVFEAPIESFCYPSVHVCLCTTQMCFSFSTLDGECTVSKFIGYSDECVYTSKTVSYKVSY